MVNVPSQSRGRRSIPGASAGVGALGDEDLLAAVGHRDLAALAEVYDRYAPRLYGLILKIVGDRSDADDVLQQVFWHLWRRGPAYDRSRSSPSVWLILITRSRAVDFLRRRARQAAAPLDLAGAEPADGGGVRSTEAAERSQRARAAMAQLPPEQREAICLSFYRGLSHVQIAELLCLPLGTVKTRIRLGMNRLRELLAERSEVSRR